MLQPDTTQHLGEKKKMAVLIPALESRDLTAPLHTGAMNPGVVSDSGNVLKDQGAAEYRNQNTSLKTHCSVNNFQTHVMNELTMGNK
mmetsp:Transcript_25657/g.29607  ORF Transcript_25657/g.29607 Transcript_25657/m.29607 type:complete len:87 (-) Transcript_25657:147-407(-)